MNNYKKDFPNNEREDTFLYNLFRRILKRNPTSQEYHHHIKFSNRMIKCHEFLQCSEYNDSIKQKYFSVGPHKRFAIQISGHFRNFRTNLHRWRDFVGRHRNYVDIFIHTWLGNGSRSSNKWITESERLQIDINEIISVLEPKKLIIENNREYLADFAVSNKCPNTNIYFNVGVIPYLKDDDFSKFIISQLYSIYMVNNLRKEYEKIKHIKYDLVFRVRADYFADINFGILNRVNNNPNILYVNNTCHKHPLGGGGCSACIYEYPIKTHIEHVNDVCDLFYYGSPIIIDKVSSIYLHIFEILNKFDLHNKQQIGKYPSQISFENFNTIIVKNDILYETVFKCCYPERIIREFLKDDFIVSDPARTILY